MMSDSRERAPDEDVEVSTEMVSAARDVLVSAYDPYALVCEISEDDLAAVYRAMRAVSR